MTKTTLTATDSFGKTFTRTTARDYAFVVVTRADNKNVALYASMLEELIARRDELGTEGIERAAKNFDFCWEKSREVQKSDYRLSRQLVRKADEYHLDATIVDRIEDCERRLRDAEERAASSKVGRVQWTSRLDLAEKAAAKARENGSVEIVPVG